MTHLPANPARSELLIYQTEDGQTRIQVRLEDETVWLTQADMAQLFKRRRRTSPFTLKMSFRKGSWTRRQPVRISYKFKSRREGRFSAAANFTTLMPLFLWATESKAM